MVATQKGMTSPYSVHDPRLREIALDHAVRHGCETQSLAGQAIPADKIIAAAEKYLAFLENRA